MVTDYRKITHALLYLVQNTQKNRFLHKLKALKLFFLADRFHMRKYGTTISGDRYIAMEHGPVGSQTRDILQMVPQYYGEKLADYAKDHIKIQGTHYFTARKECDRAFLSDTEVEALDFAIAEFGRLRWQELCRVTHMFPEWYKHRIEAVSGRTVPDMNLEDFFTNPSEDDEIRNAELVELKRKYGKLVSQYLTFDTEYAKNLFQRRKLRSNLWGGDGDN